MHEHDNIDGVVIDAHNLTDIPEEDIRWLIDTYMSPVTIPFSAMLRNRFQGWVLDIDFVSGSSITPEEYPPTVLLLAHKMMDVKE